MISGREIDSEKVQKSLDYDRPRAFTGFASARRTEVDSQPKA